MPGSGGSISAMKDGESILKGKKRIMTVILSFAVLTGTGCAGSAPENGAETAAEGALSGDNAAADDAGQAQEARARKTETIAFGEGSDWESWPEYLYHAADEETFAFAFITAGDGSADFDWAYYDDRESMTDAFAREKAGREDLTWYFLKLRIDSGVCGMEIYDYFEQYYAEDGYLVEAWSMDDSDGAYVIYQEWEKSLKEDYELCAKRGMIIQNGYLFLLACEAVNDENRKAVGDQIFAYEWSFQNNEYGGGWLMDEDTLYWSDHTARTTTLENPERKFVEERASDETWPEKLMGYFGLVSEAEYRVRLAPDMPEMTITFRLKEDLLQQGQDIYLMNGFVMDEPYQMEIKTAEGGELVQKTDVNLSIEHKDIIFFEDLDEDGYLDMRILAPTHESGSDELYVKEEEYWVWESAAEQMIRVDDRELQARRTGAAEEAGEEAFPETDIGYVPVTVKRGDSLWKISEAYYGDGKYWGQIYEYNRSVIGENPSLIYEGMELIFPFMD